MPDTLWSNDPAAVLAFCKKHAGTIYKPVHGGAHTRRVEPRDLEPARGVQIGSHLCSALQRVG